jgi:hypothetical protein
VSAGFGVSDATRSFSTTPFPIHEAAAKNKTSFDAMVVDEGQESIFVFPIDQVRRVAREADSLSGNFLLDLLDVCFSEIARDCR